MRILQCSLSEFNPISIRLVSAQVVQCSVMGLASPAQQHPISGSGLGRPILLLACPLHSAKPHTGWTFSRCLCVQPGTPPCIPGCLLPLPQLPYGCIQYRVTLWILSPFGHNPQLASWEGQTAQLCSLLGHKLQEQTQTRGKLTRKKEDILLSKGIEY